MTLREFDGSINDKIQRRALESIKRQSYTNYKLIVTNFKEKSVRNILDEYNFNYEFYQSKLQDHHMSWSEVIINSFRHIIKGNNIVLWTNADNIFENNFFEEIVNNFVPLCAGTSWPMLYYNSLEDFENGITLNNEDIINSRNKSRNPYKSIVYKIFMLLIPNDTIYKFDPNLWVPDEIFIDGDLFLDGKNRKDFIDHKMDGAYQGMAQSLMLAFYAKILINIVYKSKVSVIRNLPKKGEITWIDNPKLKEESINNTKILEKLCVKRSINKKFRIRWPLAKLNQHKKYSTINHPKENLAFKLYIFSWTLYNYWKLFAVVGSPWRFINFKKYFKKLKTILMYK